MNSKTITIDIPLTSKEVVDRLSSMTITDFASFHNSPNALYYGEIKSETFNIKNVQYGPMSSAPNIEGEIVENGNHSLVKINLDIESHYNLIRSMYFRTLIPIGLIIMLLSVLLLGGTEFQLQGIIFSSVFVVCAFLYAAIMKTSLIRMKKKEIKQFAAKVNGHIISQESIKISFFGQAFNWMHRAS